MKYDTVVFLFAALLMGGGLVLIASDVAVPDARTQAAQANLAAGQNDMCQQKYEELKSREQELKQQGTTPEQELMKVPCNTQAQGGQVPGMCEVSQEEGTEGKGQCKGKPEEKGGKPPEMPKPPEKKPKEENPNPCAQNPNDPSCTCPVGQTRATAEEGPLGGTTTGFMCRECSVVLQELEEKAKETGVDATIPQECTQNDNTAVDDIFEDDLDDIFTDPAVDTETVLQNTEALCEIFSDLNEKAQCESTLLTLQEDIANGTVVVVPENLQDLLDDDGMPTDAAVTQAQTTPGELDAYHCALLGDCAEAATEAVDTTTIAQAPGAVQQFAGDVSGGLASNTATGQVGGTGNTQSQPPASVSFTTVLAQNAGSAMGSFVLKALNTLLSAIPGIGALNVFGGL